jgi:phosphohistidine phosphatase
LPDPIQQASAIPFRRQGERVEFCMISSMSGRRWGFPKGIIEGADTAAETALKESLEEAGLHGRILGERVGTYRYQKWGTDLDVSVYVMEVTQADATWQEGDVRDRVWLAAKEARKRIERDDLAAIFEAAIFQVEHGQ